MMEENIAEKIKELLRVLYDSFNGYKECSDKIDNAKLKEIFLTLSLQRLKQIREINDQVKDHIRDLPDKGTISGSLHRTFVTLKSFITNNDEKSIIAEVKKGENTLIDAYVDLLKAPISGELSEILKRQLIDIENNLKEIDISRL